ncbi:hypothetical protein Hena1_01360 [Erwinia phage Hena1]|uniref:O-spanin n=1 Tax=Erwinia phage Hena1 TaxID=2678601 RepID=A0A6B9JB88_9CAUD|nr:hypothetical protein HWC84_gp228 [Erwinia phage Hena1]QGZ16286.1 hypothetical protein Hena1_01360 [Erwinia phage Hena1]
MKKLIAILFAMTLVGCTVHPTVVPVVEKPKVSDLIAKPPAEAMKDPMEPIPLKKGDTTAGNTAIMRQNNLNGLTDRTKLRTLQEYVRNLFKDEK